jgi:ADP-ribose pyrophosphatase YjhB (NUDIX family)
MAKIIHGHRISKTGRLLVGSSAIIYDPDRQKILLTRRTDNGRWCLPGGQMETGESAAENCRREVWEETGLRVRVTRLIGVYTNPHRLLQYADGNRFHLVSFSFEAEIVDGQLTLSNETTEFGYFTPAEIEQLDLMEHHRERVVDALTNQTAAFFR